MKPQWVGFWVGALTAVLTPAGMFLVLTADPARCLAAWLFAAGAIWLVVALLALRLRKAGGR